jgi:endonuclease/exonuclease/phosphatase family metal-dependent hydrolase
MKNRLMSGEALRTDEFLGAPDGSCYLIMQADGNLCLYAGKNPGNRGNFLWGAIGQSRPKGAYFATMQADGNFVIYQGIPGGEAVFVWSTGTQGEGGAFAATLEKFGTFTVANGKAASAPLWAVRHLRLLTYNIHLIEDSAVATGAALTNKKPVIFHDEARYGYMLGKIRASGADIVALQEVWSADNMDRIMRDLRGDYPFSHRGSNGGALSAGSGIVMLSKYALSEGSFYEFRGASDWEDKLATKGVIAATVNVGANANIRVGTSHCWTDAGGAECRNISDAINQTRQGARPMILMGDFNIHRRQNPTKFGHMESLMSAVGAADSWKSVHGPDWTDACATDDQIDNNLAQFFSPDRDTPSPDCIDYVYLRSTAEGSLRPVAAQVPRDWAIGRLGEFPPWYWVHQGTVAGQPSATVFGTKLCVVARSLSNTLQTALYDSATRRWVHSTIQDKDGNVITASSPSVVWYNNVLHLFFQRWGQVYKMESTDAVHWSHPNSQGENFKSSGGVSAVLHGGTIVAFVRDPTGNGVFTLRWTNQWTKPVYVGIDTPHDISAAATGNRLCVVTRDSNGSARGGVMRALLDESGHWQCGQLGRGITTSGSPGITAAAKGFDIFYREHDGGGIFHQSSADGINWSAIDFTGHATTDAVCAVGFKDTTMIFYPFVVNSGDHVVYSQRAMAHGLYPPAVRLDSSDHYPYQVDVIWSR